jgi:hypothetical protein
VIRRLLAIVFVLLSLVGLAVCVAGIVGAWWVQQPLLQKATRAFDVAGRALDVTDHTLDLITAGLDRTREDLSTIKSKYAAMSKDDMKPDVNQRMISRVLADQLGPKMKQVRQAVDIATEASVVMNSFLAGLNDLPKTAVGSLDLNRLGQVRDSLSDVTHTSLRLSDLLNQGSAAADDRDVAAATGRIAEVLDRITTVITELHERVGKAQSDVAEVKPRTMEWIHKGPTVVSVVLGWFALSQVIVLGVAVSWFRSRTPPAP